MKGSVYLEKRVLPPTKTREKPLTKFYVISRVNGRKRSHGGFSKRLAEAKQRALLASIADGTFDQVETDDLTVGEYYVTWIEEKRGTVKESTLKSYRHSFEKRILPVLGKKKLSRIKPSDIQTFITSLNYMNPSSQALIYGHLRSFFNRAEDLEFIEKSPCQARKIKRRRRDPKVVKCLEPHEVQALLDAAPDPMYRAMFGTLALAGFRVSEMLGLRVHDVDMLRREIHVRQIWDINTRKFSTPKTRESSRSIEMLDQLHEILEGYFAWRGPVKPDALMFPGRISGQPVDYNYVLSRLGDASELAGLSRVRPHELRHGFGSILLHAGVPIPNVCRILGHANPQVTMMVYAHELKTGLGEMLDQVNGLFDKPHVIDLQTRQKGPA